MCTSKFRVFVKDDRYWVPEWMYYVDLKDEVSEFYCRVMCEHELMQLARVVDKVEYYEWDIVSSNSYKDKKWVITWVDDSEYCWFIPKEVWKDSLSFFVSWWNMEVIGNIYEHPHLLTK